ncbi:MAG: hypothetical protein J5582_12020 [Ruminococcus sp.]|uniref:hypothetical protein n=1 Tax=Ruminococcus sp. TaxID=41978 RepID=UPI0025E94F85|nr:hypothetical protein [Ruminococcus sp.]MBO4867262.1 hypothetical protein [Ruminococcus sp.]
MKTKAKAALIAGAAIVGVAGGIWLTWCRGIDYEKRYKDLFDKTFKGDYKITVTKSGLTYNPKAPFKIPFRYKIYDIEYKDKNGNVRHFDLNTMAGYESSEYVDESITDYIKNRYKKSDYYVMISIVNDINDIARKDANYNVIPEYFDVKYDPDVSSLSAKGDGYEIVVFPFEISALYVDGYGQNDDKIAEYISPENCPVLSDIDLSSAAKSKTYMLSVTININDETKYDMIDELTEKADAFCKEYTAASDVGGNYKYIVRTIKGEKDETETIDSNNVFVINGEKVDLDPNGTKAYNKHKDMIVEKCGYNISEK